MSEVNHPKHYRSDTGHEAIDVIEAWELSFNLGNAVKYISRCGQKGEGKEIQDLEKAAWYINREIARRGAGQNPTVAHSLPNVIPNVIVRCGGQMAVTPEQKRVIDSILSIFETGKLPTPASYSTCTILSDGAGISYGKHQSTDRAGSLDKIVDLYIHRGGVHAADLLPHVKRLAANESALVDPRNPPTWATQLIGVLRAAGADPIMQQSQDEVFDSNYWVPALGHAQSLGLVTALGHLVVYDTCIHSGPGGVAVIRARFPELPPVKGGDEKAWVRAYVKARSAWLTSSSNPLVQRTVYRMDAIEKIIGEDNWSLSTPLTVRSVKIT
jgi:chitosanase